MLQLTAIQGRYQHLFNDQGIEIEIEIENNERKTTVHMKYDI